MVERQKLALQKLRMGNEERQKLEQAAFEKRQADKEINNLKEQLIQQQHRNITNQSLHMATNYPHMRNPLSPQLAAKTSNTFPTISTFPTHPSNSLARPTQSGMLPRHLLHPTSIPAPTPPPPQLQGSMTHQRMAPPYQSSQRMPPPYSPSHRMPGAQQLGYSSATIQGPPTPMPMISDVVSLNQSERKEKTDVKPEGVVDVKTEPIDEHHRLSRLSSYESQTDIGTKKRPITLDSSSDEEGEGSKQGNKRTKTNVNTTEDNGDSSSSDDDTLNDNHLSETSSEGSAMDSTVLPSENNETINNETQKQLTDIHSKKKHKKSRKRKKKKEDCTSKEDTAKERLFKIAADDLEGIDQDIIDMLKKQTIPSLGVLLAKRSQSLKVLKQKIYSLMKTLIKDVDLPEYCATDVDDNTVNDILDSVIQANSECVDEVDGVEANSECVDEVDGVEE